jgi:hypothetical protein
MRDSVAYARGLQACESIIDVECLNGRTEHVTYDIYARAIYVSLCQQ